MNFFKLYIGDYQRDTAQLSIAEHGAFLLMLQHYYATEKPLPVGKALHRMLRAQDKLEREAIDAVVAQFWRVTDEGLVNDRADAEISKAKVQADTNRVIAKAREDRRRAQRKEHESCSERATNDQPNHNHSHNQTPENTHTAMGEAVACVGDASPTLAGSMCRAMRQAGIADTNPGHPDLLALIEAGATVAELIGAAKTAVERGKGFAYVLGTLKRQRQDAAQTAQSLHRGAMPSTALKTRTAQHGASDVIEPA